MSEYQSVLVKGAKTTFEEKRLKKPCLSASNVPECVGHVYILL